MKPYSVPLFNRICRRIFRPLFRLLFHALSSVKIIGRENIPVGKAYIINMNHVSLYDPPLLIAFWPTPPEGAAAIDVWRKPGQGLVARIYASIPVHRGEYDRKATDTMIAALNSGRPLLLAPEGRRSHGQGMHRAMPGVAYLVEKTKVPVVPVGVAGTTDDFFDRAIHFHRPKVEIHIGKPIILPAVEGKGAVRREALQANADRIMREIGALLPAEYRGVYQVSEESE
jgi:1-acyl-sn-glycerol-3-phosphate acyltransferase